MADLRIVDAPLLSIVKGTEKIPTGGEGNFSVSVNQVADFAKLKWVLATEGYVDNAVGNVQADLNLHKNNISNPHQVTKVQVGLGNVDNTADLDKPLSNANIAALSLKADKTYVDSQDQLKADKITTYTKTEVDSEFYGIYQNGAALPYDENMEYAEGAVVLKDGELQKKQGAAWVSATNKGYNLDYFVSGKSYPLHAEIMLTNGNIVKSTIDGNTNDPNVDMTGWKKPRASEIFDESGLSQQEINDRLTDRGKTLYISDYGIIEGLTSNEVLLKFANLTADLDDGFTIDFQNTLINTAGNLIIQGFSDITIINPNIVGDQENWTFSGSSRGVIRCIDCPNIKIHTGYIKGVKKTNPNVAMATSVGTGGRFQDGDAGIELTRCDNFKVYDIEAHHVKTWGILAVDSDKGVAHDNEVYDCVRQSGISLSLGNTKDLEGSITYNNKVYDCGLYGIEIEKQGGKVRKPLSYDNIVKDCQAGFMFVNQIHQASIHDNIVQGCTYGIGAVNANSSISSEDNNRNFVRDNTLIGNYYAIAPSSSKYITYIGNNINGFRSDDWFIYSPYDTVEIVLNSTQFYCLSNLPIGFQFKIRDVVSTVVSATSVTGSPVNEEIGLTTVYLITVDQLPSDIKDYTSFKRSLTGSYGYRAFLNANTAIKLIGNTIRNVTNGIDQTATYTANNENLADGNTFENVTTVYSGNNLGMYCRNSTYRNCTNIALVSKLQAENIKIRSIGTVSNGAVLAATTPKPSQNLYVYDEPQQVCRMRVVAKNVSWTTTETPISFVVRLNGVDSAIVSVAAKATDIDTVVTFLAKNTVTGVNTIQCLANVPSMSCDSWQVEVFAVN